MVKQCSTCKEPKEVEQEFYIQKTGRRAGKPYSECISCLKARNRRRYESGQIRYRKNARSSYWRRLGMTQELYEEMLLAQNGVCAICSTPPQTEKLFVDHDHDTGRVRGLLCRKCNSMLGFVKDEVSIFLQAISYLERR